MPILLSKKVMSYHERWKDEIQGFGERGKKTMTREDAALFESVWKEKNSTVCFGQMNFWKTNDRQKCFCAVMAQKCVYFL